MAEVFQKQCRVSLDHPDPKLPNEFLCSYRRAGVVGQSEVDARERTPVAVGDRVLTSRTSPDSGVVEGVCERRNRLMRPAPGREGRNMQHVLACNLDLVVIVASLREPEFSPGLVDRFLVAAQAAGIPALICVTKMDLAGHASDAPWRIYRELGFDVRTTSVRSGEGIDELRSELLNKIVVFCGRSGAGKTSLLRSLLKNETGKIADVSLATGKGKHTTTSAVLLEGPERARWIDTPGVREFGLAEVEPESLAGFFPEIRSLHCPTVGCLHEQEPGCLASGLPRLPSYQRILASLREGLG